MNIKKLISRGLATTAFAGLTMVSVASHAGALSFVLNQGTNEIQDSDAERVLSYQDGSVVTSGAFHVGDTIESVLNFNTLNSNAFSSFWNALGGPLPNGYQLNAYSQLKITSISDGVTTLSTAGQSFAENPATNVTLTFGASGNLTNSALVNLYEYTGAVGQSSFSTSAAPATGIANVQSETLLAQLGLVGANSDFWSSTAVNSLGAVQSATAGSGQAASGVFGVSVVNNPGNIHFDPKGILSPVDGLYHAVVGDASIYARENGVNSNWLVSSNLNASFAVPEPGTLALLGIGLLGMGASLRRRHTA